MTDQKPREWALMWMIEDESGLKSLIAFPLKKPLDFNCEAHVIEHSAYAKALSDLEKAKAALRFYANPDKYDFHEAWGKVCILASDTEDMVHGSFIDLPVGGKLARACLAELGEG